MEMSFPDTAGHFVRVPRRHHVHFGGHKWRDGHPKVHVLPLPFSQGPC